MPMPACRDARALLVAVLLALWLPPSAFAQTETVIPGCTPRQADNPPRVVFDCAGGLTIEAEGAAELGLAPGNRSPGRTLELEDGAALIEVTPGRRKTFQIRTPHAIASVRGTVYAVDVTDLSTSVFVVRGRVRVTRRSGRAGVMLRAGEGTEVSADKPIVARRWDTAKVSALLARFGR